MTDSLAEGPRDKNLLLGRRRFLHAHARRAAEFEHRLLEDHERLAVGYDTVDKICAEFHMIFDDFIDDVALEERLRPALERAGWL